MAAYHLIKLKRIGRRYTDRAMGIVCVVTFAAALLSGSSSRSEYDVKAAYLCDFAAFVQWPSGRPAGGAFGICVLGMDPFGRALDSAVAGQKFQGMPVVVRRVSTVKEAEGCRILFISSSEAGSLTDVLREVSADGVLTVSDIPQFIDQGGMIDFVLQQNHVRFEVNVAAARRAGLVMSSQLLKVAAKVEQSRRTGAS